MAQMFQILTQTNATITALANQNVVGYAQDPPHGMSQGWNTKNQADEEQEQGPTLDLREPAPFRGAHKRTSQSEERWQSLEEQLRTIEGRDKYGLEAMDLCLVPYVGLSIDFKTPEFDKYKGSSCPRVHLAMYCRKMAAYIYDDKDSLIGATLSWYVSLERGRIKTWRDLAEAFLKQY
ncbi:hypothetical protein CR513_26020, partial [Mucuna pruriens]